MGRKTKIKKIIRIHFIDGINHEVFSLNDDGSLCEGSFPNHISSDSESSQNETMPKSIKKKKKILFNETPAFNQNNDKSTSNTNLPIFTFETPTLMNQKLDERFPGLPPMSMLWLNNPDFSKLIPNNSG